MESCSQVSAVASMLNLLRTALTLRLVCSLLSLSQSNVSMVPLRSYGTCMPPRFHAHDFPHFASSLATLQTVLKRVLLHAPVRVHNQNPTVVLHAPGRDAPRTLCVRCMHAPACPGDQSAMHIHFHLLTREAGAHCRTSHFRDKMPV